MTIQVTDVKVRPMKTEGKIVAFADVVLNEGFCVTNVKVINGSKGIFITMPSTKDKAGAFRDICFPINKECRSEIEKNVLAAYNKMQAGGSKPDNDDLDI